MLSWVDVNGWRVAISLGSVSLAWLSGERVVIRLVDGNVILVQGSGASLVYERIEAGQGGKLGSIHVRTSFSGSGGRG